MVVSSYQRSIGACGSSFKFVDDNMCKMVVLHDNSYCKTIIIIGQ
jgi:hypothetical protein